MSKQSTKKNFLYNMIYQATIMILPLITMPYIARVLGAEGIGVYSYTYSIAQYFLMLGMLGVENYGNRSIARVRDNKEERNKVFSSIYSLQLLTASIAVIVYLLFTFCILKVNKIYASIQLFYVLSAVLDINWLFFGMEDFKITVTRKVLIKFINFICIFIFIHDKKDLWKYLLLLSLGYFIAQSSMWFFAKKYVTFKYVPLRESKTNLKENIILFIPILATSVYRVMDKIMLGSMSDMKQQGYYESSEKLITVCLYVISAFGAVMMPRMSNMFANGKRDECKDLLERSMEVAIFIGCAIAFGVSAVAQEFIPVFYGEGYEECVIITQMLTITVVFITWASIIRNLYLIPTSSNKIYIYSVVLGAVVNVIANAILIPLYAARGAVIGTIIAEVTVAIFQTVLVRKVINVQKCAKKSMPFLLIGVVMFMSVAVFRVYANFESLTFLLLGEITCGAIVYILLSSIYFYFTRNKLFMTIIYKLRHIKE